MGQVRLDFDLGTLVVTGEPEDLAAVKDWLTWDERTRRYRAPARNYRDVILTLHQRGLDLDDHARAFEPLDLELASPFTPHPHQAEALEAWWTQGRRGIVELPTGAGKTFLAILAIVQVKRPTLVVVPTIDLMVQWQRVLQERLGRSIGVVGGGEKDRQEITITTYDSAQAQMEHVGNRHGFLICDECHHLPAPAYRFIAEASLAPFRLGLTATLERTDGGEAVAEKLLGPLAYQISIDQLEGSYLAPYDVETVSVELTEAERARYDSSRAMYLQFLRGSGISFSSPGGWGRFIAYCHQSDEGRAAFAAYREQRGIALRSEEKLEALWRILVQHRGERTLVFTEDNETVYALSRRFFLPAITHQTRPKERKELLEAFASGRLPVMLTSKVLNEGVDVPDARVGVVLSGSGSVREHVQRLGRILRPRPGKRAVLYEICTEVEAEVGIRERRRQHRAYEGKSC